MSLEVDPRVLRFVRGQLRGEELEAFERELDAQPDLQRQIARLSATVAPTFVANGEAPTALGERALRLGELLGRGGMANVHSAWQPHLGREVAVKTLRATDDTQAHTRLVHEARLTGWLEHPAVVPVHDLVEENGQWCVVMKRIEGLPWARLMLMPDEVRSRFELEPLDWHVTVAIAVCRALQFAHQRGVIHRDVKPANVMIGRFGEVYLLDWGIAGLLAPDAMGQLPCVHDGPEAGTPAFMAPEQLTSGGKLGPRTDVYLAAGCLFQALTGRAPFAEATLDKRHANVLLEPALDVSEPLELVDIVRRGLRADAEQRFSSADELRRALEGFLRHRDARRLVASATTRAASANKAWDAKDWAEGERAAIEAEFGYRAALELWPEDEATQRSREALQARRVRVAVEQGEVRAASYLLAGVASPPERLVNEVRAAVRAEEDERQRLEALSQARDRRVGLTAKRGFLAVFGLVWAVFWCVVAARPPETTRPFSVFFGVTLLVGLGITLASRRTLLSHARNREMMLLQLVLLLGSLGVSLGAEVMTLRVDAALVLLMLVWSLAMAALAIIIEPASAIPAAAWALAFLVSLFAPPFLPVALGVAACVHAISPLVVSLRVRAQ
ncbi:MAG: protein kinase [Archangium sp.]